MVEHDQADLEITHQELKTGGFDYTYEVVQNENDFINALTNFIPDVILCDYALPSFSGNRAFEIREQMAPVIPFILVSGTIGEENSIELIKNGVTDFVLKDKMFALNTKLIRALKDAKEHKAKSETEQELKKAYEERNMVLESIDDGFFAVDKNSLVTYWNRRAEILLDAKKEDVIGKDLHKMFSTADSTVFFDNYQKALRENSTVHFEGFSTRSSKWFEVSAFASDNGMSVYFKDITDRRRSEDKIKESELRYRSIIEQATDAICIADASMKIIDINLYGCQMLGYSKEEFLKLTINDLFVPEDLKANPFKIEELKSGKVIRNERRFKCKDGTLIDVEMSGRILADGRFIVFGHDIAERKKAQDKIKESELRYRSLIEQATDAICITNASLKFIDINPYGCEILGYTLEEGLQLSLPDIIFPEDLIGNPIKVTELELGATLRNERRLKRKDGSAIDMEVSTKMMEDGSLIMFGHDITQRKKTELVVKESEIRYRTLFEQNLAGVYQSNEEGVILNCNDAFAKMLKYDSPDELLKNNASVLYFSPEARHDFIKTILHSKKLHNHEALLKCKDNSPINVLENISLRTNDLTGEVFFDGILIDITERTSAKVDLVNMSKELQESLTGEIASRTNAEKSEKRYRQIVETAQEGIWLIDEKNKTTFVNNKMCEILEYSREEMIGRTNLSFKTDEEQTMALEQIERRKKGIGESHEARFVTKSGKHILTQVSTNPIFNDEGVYSGALAMMTDITESKKAEEKIKKLNRLYTFISQVNQNIVHIKDETELFRNSCQIAFEFGKFKIAWIGLFNDSRERILLVDQSGIPLEHVGLFSDLPCEKNGPQETALKTGIYLCNDPEGRPELNTWLPFAAKQGIRSAIVLPIKKSGHIIGTFNLYATELNFFDKEEIALLTDVTDDISFALDIFENAKKHEETEALILKNEKRFRALIEKSSDMEALSTKEGKMIYGSPAITEVLGYSLEEFCHLYSFDTIHPDDIAGFIEKRNGIMEIPGKSFTNQNRFRHKNGSWIWCEGSITNMLHEPGVNALVSNFRDISEKKITEQQREFDSINLDALINNTSDLMWSVDRDCRLITFNQPFFEIIKSVTGKEIAEGDDVYSVVVSPQQLNRFKISYARAFAGDTFTEIEHIPSPVNSWSEISYSPIRKGAEIIGTACHSRNITERKKAEEEALRTLNEKNIILESIGDAFFAVDKNWAVTYWNNHAEEMLGVPKNEIVGHLLWEVFKSSIDSESYRRYHEAIETNQVIQFEDYYPVLNKWYEISAYPSEKGLSVYFKDITERKVSHIRLNDLNKNLQQQAKELAISNMELEQFAYVASHDLQEPLRMVTSFLTQLDKRYGGVIDEKGKQYIYFAVDGAKRMRQIILDLLEYSRAGRTLDSLEDIDLNRLVEEIQILFSKQIEEQKAVITADQLPELRAHRSPIRQIFQNLIGNALKYTKDGRQAKIHIAVKISNDHWQFSVNDNGIGIEQEYFEKIFIIFQRLHNKEEFSGTGMGLAITKKIIESQGGKIWVESEEGKGSTFYFTLPKELAI